MRRIHRKDNSQDAIVEALRGAGAHVEIIGRPVDLLVHYRGWHLIECKTDGWNPKDKRQEEQRAFCKAFSVPICETPEEALRAVGIAHELPNDFKVEPLYSR
jgi:hypothetical protein